MRVRLMRGFFTLLFISLVSGGTWLATYPVRWILQSYGLMAGALAVPPFLFICWLALVWLEKPRH